MKNKLIKLYIIMIVFTISNCVTGPVHGLLFTSNSFPGEFNPANDVPVTKTAEGCQHNVIMLFGFGTASAGAIALENKIERIATIDHSTLSVFTLLYRNYCTIVSGEAK